jgi:hypothetical protein
MTCLSPLPRPSLSGGHATPVNIDPGRPDLPISQPATYATYLAKLFGPYSTLGLAEDTWALNEEVLDDQAFLAQCYANHEDRERMLRSRSDSENDERLEEATCAHVGLP